MAFFDTNHQRAAWLVAILGIVIVVALAPYASGLLGAPVLFVIFGPLHVRLSGWFRSRNLAAIAVILIALVGLVLPIAWVVTLLVGQAQEAAKGVLTSPLLGRLDTLTIGPFAVGQQLKELGSQLVSLMGGSAISLLGTATRITLNLLFTFFGFYYLLMDPHAAWRGLRPYIPFSDENVEVLRERFGAVTVSTVLGTGLCALAQGALVATAFAVVGIGDPVFWGAVTMVLAVLPVVGSGMVWGPAAIVLFASDRLGAAIGMALWGALVVGNIDNVIRPWISNRYAQVHPLITLVGAIAGVSYMGILGLLIGPLALSYFFELLTMYRHEYLSPAIRAEAIAAAAEESASAL
ncbi:MAG TPA: AI-2E family transporter [Gemmatimonadales bacterium]|nr:AI-2E family transporter [Gemmatimonadales bacterium]